MAAGRESPLMPVEIRRNRVRFYLATFDLQDTVTKTALYGQVEKALRGQVGNKNYHRFVKQCAFLETDIHEDTLYSTIRKIVGSDANILIVQLRPEHKSQYISKATKLASRKYFQRLEASEESE